MAWNRNRRRDVRGSEAPQIPRAMSSAGKPQETRSSKYREPISPIVGAESTGSRKSQSNPKIRTEPGKTRRAADGPELTNWAIVIPRIPLREEESETMRRRHRRRQSMRKTGLFSNPSRRGSSSRQRRSGRSDSVISHMERRRANGRRSLGVGDGMRGFNRGGGTGGKGNEWNECGRGGRLRLRSRLRLRASRSEGIGRDAAWGPPRRLSFPGAVRYKRSHPFGRPGWAG